MTRTNPWHLIVAALLGGAALFLLEVLLVAGGRPAFVPPLTLAVVLGLIGVLVVLLARPVRRVARREPNARVDPFYAIRVVTVAKACSLIGALLGGGAIGIVLFLTTRTVTAGGSVLLAAGGAAGALVLLAGGLVAEWMCTIRPDGDEDEGDRIDPQEEPA